MSALRNLPISRKLLFGFGSVCLLTAVLGTVALISFHRINANVDDIVSNSMPSVKVLADIRTNAAAIRRTDGFLAMCDTPACVETQKSRRQKVIDNYKSALATYEPLISYPGERELYTKFRDEIAQYLQYSDSFVQMVDTGKMEEARHLATGALTMNLFDSFNADIEQDKDLNDKMGKEEGVATISLGKNASILMWITLLSAVGLSIFIGMLLNRFVIAGCWWLGTG